jgi:Fur family transcriptional regulator, ferric uptake regulator
MPVGPLVVTPLLPETAASVDLACAAGSGVEAPAAGLAGSSINGFLAAQPVRQTTRARASAPARAGVRLEQGSDIRIKGLNSLSNWAKTLYDKAHNLNPTNNMTSNPSELKASGLKATLPRLKILEIFQSSQVRHLSAEDVYKILLTENMDVGLATVYRVLTQFEQAGLLHRNHFETGKAVFELNEGSHHDHLVCLDCGRVEEFFDEEIEKRQQGIARERGFDIAEHALALYGHCSKTDCPHRPR